MYLAINIDNFNSHFVMLSEKTKNNVMTDSDFYRLYYSNTEHNSNGLYVFITLMNITISKYFNKLKASFIKDENNDIIQKLKKLEKDILYKYASNKIPIFRINEQLNNNFIKVFGDYNDIKNLKKFNIILKISGIWSDNTNYGLTFRFYIVNNILC